MISHSNDDQFFEFHGIPFFQLDLPYSESKNTKEKTFLINHNEKIISETKKILNKCDVLHIKTSSLSIGALASIVGILSKVRILELWDSKLWDVESLKAFASREGQSTLVIKYEKKPLWEQPSHDDKVKMGNEECDGIFLTQVNDDILVFDELVVKLAIINLDFKKMSLATFKKEYWVPPLSFLFEELVLINCKNIDAKRLKEFLPSDDCKITIV